MYEELKDEGGIYLSVKKADLQLLYSKFINILDSCPIYLKCKCYVFNQKSYSNSTMKLCDIKNDGHSKSKQSESRTKLFSGNIVNTIHQCY